MGGTKDGLGPTSWKAAVQKTWGPGGHLDAHEPAINPCDNTLSVALGGTFPGGQGR